ncbi:MAG: RsmB/NOP family class I SAM-dependent RNA methyltransferase [Anaerotignum sp.]|nr:RsmB/NOP family class I SAM-dependent RNA methyltransferase [Anaerotignum sp.]
MNLPLEYMEKMKALLGEEYDDYIASFEEGRFYGLRANTLKISPDALQGKGVFTLNNVPWCEPGFYYEGEERPAKHPYYHAGLYYLQEPSAMSPAATLPVEEGDVVLDLCAAPGGKTTQLAARLNGTGLLVANDISAGRAKTLLKNVELMGIRNAIVMSETPDKIADRLPEFFDKILVDAPCSGEGMFRKEPDMVKSWDEKMLEFCQTEQAKILEACAPMLKEGGMLLYSTCTFSPEENEKSIGDFLESHSEFELVEIPKENGFVKGLSPFEACARLYPHKLKGEGHFLALLRKKKTDGAKPVPAEDGKWTKQMDAFADFAKDVLKEMPKGIYKIYGDGLYLLPEDTPKLDKLRVLRTGWMLGTLKKDRFEPSQAFAMGLKKEEVKNVVDFPLEDDRVIRYLKGETVEGEGKDGWTLVCVDGFPLGWAKMQKGRLKNKYAVSWMMS